MTWFPARCVRSLATAICSLGILTGAAYSQSASEPSSAFKVTLDQLPLHCTPPLFRAYVTTETGKFTFLMPAGFRIKGDASGRRLKLSNLEGNCQFTIAILDSAPCDSQPLNADAYRDVVQARHPGGKIIEQLCPGAAGRIGVGFDMQWETTNGFAQCTRTVFIPSAIGLLEFSVVSNPKNFPTLRSQLNRLMISFQSSTPDGKLVVPRVSDADSLRSDVGSSHADTVTCCGGGRAPANPPNPCPQA